MRLICPNCDAQYEIDEHVIPDAGRDVQCSNCGHAWFQDPEGHEDDAQPVNHGGENPNTYRDDATDPNDPNPQAAIDALIREDQDADETPEPEEQEQEPDDTPPAPEISQRRGLGDDVRDVLREEASRETRARRGEPESLETQEELGLDEGRSLRNKHGVAAQERMARLRGLDVGEDTRADKGATGRELFPDIEEINDSLIPIGSDKVVDDFTEPKPRKSGFSRGFAIMLVLATIIVAIYVNAPLISEKVPALTPYLDNYISYMNQAREWLDQMVRLALSKVQTARGEG